MEIWRKDVGVSAKVVLKRNKIVVCSVFLCGLGYGPGSFVSSEMNIRVL